MAWLNFGKRRQSGDAGSVNREEHSRKMAWETQYQNSTSFNARFNAQDPSTRKQYQSYLKDERRTGLTTAGAWPSSTSKPRNLPGMPNPYAGMAGPPSSQPPPPGRSASNSGSAGRPESDGGAGASRPNRPGPPRPGMGGPPRPAAPARNAR